MLMVDTTWSMRNQITASYWFNYSDDESERGNKAFRIISLFIYFI